MSPCIEEARLVRVMRNLVICCVLATALLAGLTFLQKNGDDGSTDFDHYIGISPGFLGRLEGIFGSIVPTQARSKNNEGTGTAQTSKEKEKITSSQIKSYMNGAKRKPRSL